MEIISPPFGIAGNNFSTLILHSTSPNVVGTELKSQPYGLAENNISTLWTLAMSNISAPTST